jgi:hypothetical protein
MEASPGYDVKLSEAQIKRLQDYINPELEESLGANDALNDRVEEADRFYKAEPKATIKTFPWRGAANLVIPSIGITVDSIVARVVNTVFGVQPFWTVRAINPRMADIAKSVEGQMEWSRQTEFDMYTAVKSNAIETVQLGWSWLKIIWEIDSRRVWNPQDNSYYDVTAKKPNVYYIPVTSMLQQLGVDSPYDAEWMGQIIDCTDGDLRLKELDGIYKDVETVIDTKENPQERRSSTKNYENAYRVKLNRFYELWLKFPLEGARKPPVEIVVTYHKPTKTIMRCIYNPLFMGGTPFVKTRFVELRGSKSEGYGIVDQLKFMQDEVSTIHCQQLDNATLANTRWFLGKRGAVKADTRIWPGRFLTTANPESDIKVMQMGEVYNSMRQLEVSVMAYAERRSGISDYSLGRESSAIGDRATATGTLAIIQEGNRRFDLNVRDMRESYGAIGRMLFELNHQYRPKGLSYVTQGPQGAMTEFAFDMPDEIISNMLGFELTASSATINKQVEQAGLLQLLQMLTQNMQAGQQAAMLLANPQIPPQVKDYTAQYMESLTQLVKRTMLTFDQPPVDLPDIMQSFQQPAPGPGGMNGGGPPGPPGAMGGPPGAGGPGVSGPPQLPPGAGAGGAPPIQ